VSDHEKPEPESAPAQPPDLTEREIAIAIDFGKQLALQAIRSPLWPIMSNLHGESGPAVALRASYLSTVALAHGSAIAMLSCLGSGSGSQVTREERWSQFQTICRTTFDIAFDDALAAQERLERESREHEQGVAQQVDAAIARALTSATAAAAAGEQEGEA
jgi:hypothetical protein